MERPSVVFAMAARQTLQPEIIVRRPVAINWSPEGCRSATGRAVVLKSGDERQMRSRYLCSAAAASWRPSAHGKRHGALRPALTSILKT